MSLVSPVSGLVQFAQQRLDAGQLCVEAGQSLILTALHDQQLGGGGRKSDLMSSGMFKNLDTGSSSLQVWL